jgi:hypothetical protein
MKPTKRTFLAFDERQLKQIETLQESFTVMAQEAKMISNKDFFLIAMGVGFAVKNQLHDMKRSNNGVRIQYLLPADNVLLAALQAAETNDPTSLLQIEELYDLAERYAAGGVAILWERHQTERDFPEWFASYLFKPLKDAAEV